MRAPFKLLCRALSSRAPSGGSSNFISCTTITLLNDHSDPCSRMKAARWKLLLGHKDIFSEVLVWHIAHGCYTCLSYWHACILLTSVSFNLFKCPGLDPGGKEKKTNIWSSAATSHRYGRSLLSVRISAHSVGNSSSETWPQETTEKC